MYDSIQIKLNRESKMRDNIIQEVEEKDIEELYNLLNKTFNSNNKIEKFKELYNLSKI